MTDKTDMEELARKVEALDGPSRKVDGLIADAVGIEYEQGFCADERALPHFTASLDAATRLMPERADWRLINHPDWSARAEVNGWSASASTLALALVAAALRSRT